MILQNTFQRFFFAPIFVAYIFLLAMQPVHAQELPTLRVAVLKAGTGNWELQHLINQQYDQQHGFKLKLQKVASLSAAKIALASNSADVIVSDWLWAGKRNQEGQALRFIPFSSQIGVVLRAKTDTGQSIDQVNDLKGKKIGVAGGPLSKGWVLMQSAAEKKGINLAKENTIQFGAPPLLSQALKRGQVDVLVTFWHFGAKLKTEGFEEFISLNELMYDLGMTSRLPMLGYLFNASLLEHQPELMNGFYKAIQLTKNDLQDNDEPWEALTPLLNAKTPEIKTTLIRGYREGIPSAITDAQIDDAVKFFELIQRTQNGSNTQLDRNLFFQPQSSQR